jgi:glyoxylase-like metal-dependent hydrolase (beta-lactamase superfamily II)
VYSDPKNDELWSKSYEALLSCPTNSIGCSDRSKLKQVSKDIFPKLIEENVYHTGYHSERSFGAAAWLIKSEEGNVLIDSPRMNTAIKNKIREFGGLRWQYLTHRDDIADTDLFHDEFSSDRIIHAGDKIPKTDHYELIIEGENPYQLTDEILIIPVPGHTKGHTVLLYRNKFLFTGDHLAWSHHLTQLYAFKRHCWYDFPSQIKSMEKLLDYNFEWVLPGHGAPVHFPKEEMKKQLARCIKWMKE